VTPKSQATRQPYCLSTRARGAANVRAQNMTSAHQTLERLTEQAAQSGDLHRTQQIELGPSALEALNPFLATHRPDAADLVVSDAHTWEAAGARVLETLRSGGRKVRSLILEPRTGEDHVVCEDGVITSLETLVATSDHINLVAVGSGSVNDICKVASHRRGLPYVSVPTAASMNGYTSSIAAVLSGGVKRTWPVHQPMGVFADVDVIREAPLVMNRAGFGDLLSKPYCQADWLLSHHVRGVDYSAEAASVLDGPWNQMLEAAGGIGAGEAQATHILMETLLVSGFSMAMAGTSAPASGAEHLISHYWDMEEHGQGRPIRGLHGTQVGIGTRISSRTLWRLIRLDSADILRAAKSAQARRPDASWIDALGEHHPELTDEIVDEIQTQFREKQRHGDELRLELEVLGHGWEPIRAALEEILVPTERIDRALVEAGCITRASELAVSREHLIRTIKTCRHIRSRYVNFDLLADLGLLDAMAGEIVEEVEGAVHV
jgi:glycerol-1-phosphate dehydrogenase [NAD(P)+]